MTVADPSPSAQKNKRTMIMVSGIAVAMLGLGFASKPLYDTFCRVTNYGGTPVVADELNYDVLARKMTVRFDSNVSPDLTWDFKPEARHVTVPVGKNTLAFYNVKNYGNTPLVGTATYNVTPMKAAAYFAKLQCFCFTEQRIEPGEEVRMPVLFYIAPEIDDETRMNDVHSITLSYTFHKVANPTEDAFTEVDRNKVLSEVEKLELSQ